MRAWAAVLSGVWTGGIAALALVAAWRAAPLQVRGGADLMSGRLAQDFESHYDEQFPARTLGVNLWTALGYLLFGEGQAGVVVGADGWLFTHEEFRPYADAQERIRTHLELIAWAHEQLARRRVGLLVVLVPAKARIYPERLGGRRPARVHEELYGRAHGALRRAAIPAPDLRVALWECKRRVDVFLRTDTHWTPAGARCAARRVEAAVRAAGLAAPRPSAYRTRVETVAPVQGDLMRFLPLAPYFAGLLPPPDEVEIQRTQPADPAAAAGLLDETAPPGVVLVGTSYSADRRWNFVGALQQALGEDVASYADKGAGPFVPMLEYLRGPDLRRAPPRLAIWEIPERYLPIAEDLSPYDLPIALHRRTP